MTDPSVAPQTGLILTGGGARAAYQVGVLQQLLEMRRSDSSLQGNPFPIVCGTSSGAINASVLACGADQIDLTLERLNKVWSEFQVPQVYRTDTLDMLHSGFGWLSMLLTGWLIPHNRKQQRSILDNTPLSGLLARHIDFSRLPQLLDDGHLSALAITASSYSSGDHVTFYQGRPEMQEWVRSQRLALRCELSHAHLMASSAIPFVFPSVRLDGPGGSAWFGDGAMRQTAPISPAIHLGATRILAIGAGRMHEPQTVQAVHTRDHPPLAGIAGHAMSSIFLDSLAVDIERVHRVNQLLPLIAHEHRHSVDLRPIDLLVISPSERLDEIATRHASKLPRSVKNLLRILGYTSDKPNRQSGALISYLLFDSSYTQELMALGRRDAQARASDIKAFFR